MSLHGEQRAVLFGEETEVIDFLNERGPQVDVVQHSSQFDIVYIWISKFNAIISTIY